MSTNPDGYSPEETLITFDRPIPLLRHPIPTENHDSFILCFKNPQSFASAYESCESNIVNQCEAGARIGCSVNASKKCAPPWWKTLSGGGASKQDLIDREKCEEREMAECLEASRVSCRKLAEDKCWPAFRDAGVVVESGGGDENVKNSVAELISRVCFGRKRIQDRVRYTVVRGSDLLQKLD